jgi:aspartyl-tRNA(Asn)/glutamyl-tRNA(Gln) amidotransferase subunit A
VGVLARYVRDAALVLNVIAGPDIADALTLECPRVDLNKHIERGLKGLRIGILPEPELTQVEVPIRCLMEETLVGLVAEGALSEFAGT